MAPTFYSTYFVRIDSSNETAFERHLDIHRINYNQLSNDIGFGTILYSLRIDSRDALALKLSFPIRGCMSSAEKTLAEFDNKS